VTKGDGNDGMVVLPIVYSTAHGENGGVTDWYQEPKFMNEEEFEEGEPQEEEYDIEFEDAVEVEDTVELEDDTVLKSVHEVGESSTATFHKEGDDSLLPGFMRRDINSLFDLGNEVRSCMEEGAVAMENLVRKLGDAEERIECKKLKKELED
ncbi:hypothetical protein Tco_1535322, partial [Tanacetum coccineum]